jgi:putative transposase
MSQVVESFFSILEIEFLQVRYFKTYADAYKQTAEFINFYNNKRLHGSLNNKTPKETIKAYYAGEELKIKNLRA